MKLARGEFDAVIFDMDGLMFDTERVYSRAARAAATELGYTLDEVFYMANCVGRRVQDIKDALQAHMGPGFSVDAWQQRCEANLISELRTSGAPQKPGLNALLGWLREQNIPRGVATSTARDTALLTLGNFAGQFDAVTTGDEIKHGKPAPDIFLLAARRLNSAPERCIVLEDSTAGIRAAHAAGCIPIWVPDLVAPTPEVAALARRVCGTLDEVLALIRE